MRLHKDSLELNMIWQYINLLKASLGPNKKRLKIIDLQPPDAFPGN
jgi:hypothetical protein